jgi:TldD protein
VSAILFIDPNSAQGASGILIDILQTIIDDAREAGVDFADARAFEASATSIVVQDKRVQELLSSEDAGVGVRVLIDGSWGFAATNTLEKPGISRALEEAIAIAKAARPHVADPGMVSQAAPTEAVGKSPARIDPREIDLETKARTLAQLERRARQEDPKRVVNTQFSLGDSTVRETVVNTLGTRVENETTRMRFYGYVVAAENGKRQSGHARKAESRGWEMMEQIDPDRFAAEPTRQAVALLAAGKPPAGKLPVIVDPDLAGLFAHEAFGHNAEGDLVWSNDSILKGHEGEPIGSELATIVDDATIEGCRGWYRYDSEGTPGSRRVLLENGVLKSYMHNLESAKRLGTRPNGSGRAESHQHCPIVRMSNTFFDKGEHTFDEMVKGTRRGIFAKGFAGGYVRTNEGAFTFNCEEGWMIRDGELAEHLSNVAISGYTLETLKNIDAVGDTLILESPGTCGKNGQSMPVGGGGPYLRVTELVVGGQM